MRIFFLIIFFCGCGTKSLAHTIELTTWGVSAFAPSIKVDGRWIDQMCATVTKQYAIPEFIEDMKRTCALQFGGFVPPSSRNIGSPRDGHIYVYEYNNPNKLLVDLTPNNYPGDCKYNIEFVDKNRPLVVKINSQRSTAGSNMCTYTVIKQPDLEPVRKNKLSIKINGNVLWSPVIKIGEIVQNPRLCGANLIPELQQVTRDFCKFWYDTGISDMEINGKETNNIKVYDAKGDKLLVEMQTAASSLVTECSYTVISNEKSDVLGQTISVEPNQIACKFNIISS
jgi:hypothetical protein